MSVRALFGSVSVRVFMAIRHLPRECQPCHVERDDGFTLLTVDPRYTRFEITQWNILHLRPAEIEVFRAAFGLPPIHERAPDWTTDRSPCLLYVPPAVRLTGAPPLQGGVTLRRRRAAGTLTEELAAWQAELQLTARRGA